MRRSVSTEPERRPSQDLLTNNESLALDLQRVRKAGSDDSVDKIADRLVREVKQKITDDTPISKRYVNNHFVLSNATGSIQALIDRTIPNLRDIAVSSCAPQMRTRRLYRSARPFTQSLNDIYDVLIKTLKIQNIIDLRDDDLNAITEESQSRLIVTKFYRTYRVTATTHNHNEELNAYDHLKAIIKGLRPDLADSIVNDLATNPNTHVIRDNLVIKAKPKEKRLLIVNILDSPGIKKRVLETVTSSPYLPVLFMAKLSDKLAGTALAPFYFCKYIVSTKNIFDSYVEMIQNCGENFAIAMRIIALADGPTLFHCSLGKDRTGLLSILVLTVLGAQPSGIIFDYNLTEMSGNEEFNDYLRKFVTEYSGLAPEFSSASVDTVGKTLDYFKTEYGSVNNYLDQIGFTRDWRSLLKQRYLSEKI